MLMHDEGKAKEGIAIILASKKGEPDKMVTPKEETDNKIAMLSAAQEVLAAIKLDDPKMLYESICGLIELHNNNSEMDSEEY